MVVVDGVLGDAAQGVADGLVGLIGRLRPAGVGRGERHHVDRDLRGDEIAWLRPGEEGPLDPILAVFEQLRTEVNRALFAGLQHAEIMTARYPAGGRYERHRDAFVGQPGRRLTAIWYANPGWTADDGGELVAWDPDERVVLPILDRMVVFRSELVEHAVRPARRDRWAVTGWFRGREDVPP